MANIIDIRNYQETTAAQASINLYGADYTDGDTTKLFKFELWLDATDLAQYNANATEILGYEFNLDAPDASESLITTSISSVLFPADVRYRSYIDDGLTFNGVTGEGSLPLPPIVGDDWIGYTAIVDTNVANDGPLFFIGAEKLIGTFYVRPADVNAARVPITVTDMIVITDAGDIYPPAYTANTAPVANNDTASVGSDSATIDVLANDTDIDGDTLTVTQATATMPLIADAPTIDSASPVAL